jgi:hypothetical protein
MTIALDGVQPYVIAIDGQPCRAFEPLRNRAAHRGGLEPLSQSREPAFDERGHDGGLVLEVVIRRLMTDARTPGHFTHRETREPLLRDELHARIEHLFLQVRRHGEKLLDPT